MDDKKILFSAIQPSGILTIGNYLGALRNFKKLQDDYNSIFALADLHTLTVRQDPAILRKNTYELAATYLACGIDVDKSILFAQSHVSAHAELMWILNTMCYPGELSRMTQFKDKSRKHEDNINMGLMDYPVLMAADILLYQTELVPVGADQKQHLELARDLAIRFNNKYGETFKVPEGYISKSSARIMSLAEPDRKMSKSDANLNAFISMDDEPNIIIKKFKRAVTDSDNNIKYSVDKPGISNLLSIYCAFTDKTFEQAENEFAGFGYGDFKQAVGQVVADIIEPIRQEKNRILTDKAYIDDVLKVGAERAERLAYRTLSKVYKKVGLVPRKRWVMFGYVKTDHPNVYVKDVVLYKAMYCGLCKSIGECCGQKGRFLLSYDLTFLSLLLHNLLDEDIKVKKSHCIVHPITKRQIAEPTELSKKIGALNVILAYYKLSDDVIDNNSGRLKRNFFKRSYNKARIFQPELDQIVNVHFNKLLEYEKQNISSIDICADPFGLMISDIVKYFVPNANESLYTLSYDLGKWIYLIDALDDFDKDLKNKNFNVFVNSYPSCKSKEELIKNQSFDIASLFGLLINSISQNADKLDYKFNSDLIKNILKNGLKVQTKNIMENKKCKNTTKF